ncbi:helix-turn-helix domain-containing protein [Bradyrhizobium sp. ISRA442]|uniref:GlxA family transcriptional regulator n=1 Tax=Bradyrhizobium sp. ISRA442 TaxID=2866197 RepID=UPI00311AF944
MANVDTSSYDSPHEHTDQPKPTHRVGIIVINGSNAIDFMGPNDAFHEANKSSASSIRYQVDLIGLQPGPIIGSSGIRTLPDKIIRPNLEAIYDTILIAGTREFRPFEGDHLLLNWLRRNASSIRRICATCTGTFTLASAGLLNGRRVATRHDHAKQFAKMYPHALVEADRLFVRDGAYYTAVGGMAGIDLCLYLIENDCGRATFLDVARMLVVFLRRPGTLAQVSEFLKAQSIQNTQISQVMDWALDNLTADLSVEALAKRAAMSSRNFSRTFTDEMMTTPARFVENIRVEAARILLETTPLSIQQIAHQVGFGNPANMRRAFIRAFQAPPAEYRHSIERPEEHTARPTLMKA